jgi:hypothetical protein
MAYVSERVYLRCCLHSQQDRDVFAVLQEVMGEPREASNFHPFLTSDENVTGYQVRVPRDTFQALREKIEQLGRSFNDIFEKDWRHFHPTCVINEEFYEGLAEEREDDAWELRYEYGAPALKEKEGCLIAVVKNNDIDELDDIYDLFEAWVKEQLEKK